MDWEQPDTWTKEAREAFELGALFASGDMDLIYHQAQEEPVWLARWRQKFSDSDYMVTDSGETNERS